MAALDRKRLRRALWIFAAAAVVRGLWTFADSAGPAEIRGDATFFYQSARNLIEKHSFADDAGYRALRLPLYPGFLAALFLLAGPSVAAIQASQSLLGAATCAAIYLGATGWLAEEASLFAGWTAVFYYGLIFPCGRVLSECFYSFWLALLFAAWFLRRERWTAVSAAALYLTRPEGILAGAALAALGPLRDKDWRRGNSWLIVGALAAAMAGWGLRNKAVLGHFTPGTTGAGFSFWAALPRTMSAKLAAHPELARPPASLSEEEHDRYFWRGGMDQLKSAPPLLVLKTAAFNLIGAYYPFLPRYELTYGLILPLWLFAFWSLRDRRELWPAFLLIAAWSALYVVFGGQDARFRQLMAPLLIWLAAGALEKLRGRLSRPVFTRAAGAWVSFNILVFIFSPYVRAAALATRDWIWAIR